VETGSYEEFEDAGTFIKGLSESTILGQQRGIDSIFAVPGNHDLLFDTKDKRKRWQQWMDFHQRTFGRQYTGDPDSIPHVIDRAEDLGVIVLCLNSAMHVQKATPDEQRGRLDMKQLKLVKNALKEIPLDRLHASIRIALLHHHPILIPPLAEPKRGYDAVHNSGHLLQILREYGFQLVLHGHKHNAFTFTDDVKPAFQQIDPRPIFVAAGGSAGSTELPSGPQITNSYNRVTVKWHPNAQQTRVRVETRVLERFDRSGQELLPTEWEWLSGPFDDRNFYGGRRAPSPRAPLEETTEVADDDRKACYENTRGNFPVVEVMPSLEPGQAYEARLWIVHHAQPEPGTIKEDLTKPTLVKWSAGKRFRVQTVRAEDDPNFCIAYDYWGPMLVKADIHFKDKYQATAFVYARMPTDYGGDFGESSQ